MYITVYMYITYVRNYIASETELKPLTMYACTVCTYIRTYV